MEIDREKYNKFVLETEIKSIFLQKMDVELKDRNIKSPVVSFDLKDEVRVLEKNFYVRVTMNLRVKSGRAVPLKIKVVYEIEYSTNSIDIPQEFYEEYARTSSRVHVWPYFREIISNTILRMGLPPLVLPVIPFNL